MRDHKMVTTCPFCGHKHDIQLEVTGNSGPQAEDATMCTTCMSIAIFDTDMSLRKPTPDEQWALDNDEQIQSFRLAVIRQFSSM